MHAARFLVALGLLDVIGCGSTPRVDPGDAALGSGNHGDGPTTNGDISDVQFVTSKGTFVVELHRPWSPNGVDRVSALVNADFYDNARFFRVIAGFVVQFGINGTPTTNAMWSGSTIPDDPVMQSNTRGYVTFAQTNAPNSRTTQLFINLGNNASLDAMHFAPIGIVTSGMDVVDGLYSQYGDTPDQSQITSEGNTYLTSAFPNLDYIMTARFQ